MTGFQIAQKVEEREVARFRGEDGPDDDVEKEPRAFCVDVAAFPRFDGLPIPLGGAPGTPGGLDRDFS